MDHAYTPAPRPSSAAGRGEAKEPAYAALALGLALAAGFAAASFLPDRAPASPASSSAAPEAPSALAAPEPLAAPVLAAAPAPLPTLVPAGPSLEEATRVVVKPQPPTTRREDAKNVDQMTLCERLAIEDIPLPRGGSL